MALFAVYAWRGLRAAFRAPDEFGRLLALGITVMVLVRRSSISAWCWA